MASSTDGSLGGSRTRQYDDSNGEDLTASNIEHPVKRVKTDTSSSNKPTGNTANKESKDPKVKAVKESISTGKGEASRKRAVPGKTAKDQADGKVVEKTKVDVVAGSKDIKAKPKREKDPSRPQDAKETKRPQATKKTARPQDKKKTDRSGGVKKTARPQDKKKTDRSGVLKKTDRPQDQKKTARSKGRGLIGYSEDDLKKLERKGIPTHSYDIDEVLLWPDQSEVLLSTDDSPHARTLVLQLDANERNWCRQGSAAAWPEVHERVVSPIIAKPPTAPVEFTREQKRKKELQDSIVTINQDLKTGCTKIQYDVENEQGANRNWEWIKAKAFNSRPAKSREGILKKYLPRCESKLEQLSRRPDYWLLKVQGRDEKIYPST